METEGKPSSSKPSESQGAVSFVVNFDDSPKKQAKPPKALMQRQRQTRSTVSGETLAEKQRQAEERRKKLMEDKVERLRQLEAEMQGLARKMNPLLRAEAAKKNTSSVPPTKQTVSESQGCGGNKSLPNGLIYPK